MFWRRYGWLRSWWRKWRAKRQPIASVTQPTVAVAHQERRIEIWSEVPVLVDVNYHSWATSQLTKPAGERAIIFPLSLYISALGREAVTVTQRGRVSQLTAEGQQTKMPILFMSDSELALRMRDF